MTTRARRERTGARRGALRPVSAGVAAALAAWPAVADAQAIWTLPGNGSWTVPANWSTGAVPDASTLVRIDNGGEAQVTTPGANAAGLVVGGAAGSTGRLAVTAGGTLVTTSATPSYIGQNGAGTITISRIGSTWTNAGGLIVGDGRGANGAVIVDMGAHVTTGTAAGTTTILGNSAGASGSLSVEGAGSIFTAANTLILGNYGSGAMRVSSGGVVNSAGAVLGAEAGGNAAVTVTGLGSLWRTTDLAVLGRSGNATLNVEAGGVVTADRMIAGLEAGSNGTIKVSGTGSKLVATSGLTLGNRGHGELTVESGATVGTDRLALGMWDGSGVAKVTGAGSHLDVGGEIILGGLSDGSLTVERGGRASADAIEIGSGTAGRGALLVTGDGSKVETDRLTVGGSGRGAATIEAGGDLVTGDATIGDKSGGQGSVLVNGSGSTWRSTGELTIGADGSGGLTVVGGGAVTSETAIVGADNGGQGAVAVSGSGSSWSTEGAMTIGGAGNGALGVSLGATASAGELVLGADAGGNGAVLVTDNGSTLAIDGALTVGAGGTGALTLANGGKATAASASIGSLAGSNGAVVISNLGSALAIDGKAIIGGAGAAELLISAGGTMTSGDAVLGAASGGSGIVTITGAGSDWRAGSLTIGGAGSGTLQVTAAGTLESGAAVIGASSGATGTAIVDGGGSVWTVGGDLTIGKGGDGTLILSTQGAATIGGGAGIVTLGADAGGSGTLQIGSGGGAGTLAAAEVTGGDGTARVVFNHAELGYTFAPLVSGSVALSQIGSGVTILTAANTYTGATSVEAGTLRAGGAGVFSPASAVSVAAGGILDLAGFMQTLPSLANAGTVSVAGASAGTDLTVAGNYTGQGGTLVLGVALGGDASPADRLVVAGDVSGKTAVSISNLGGRGALTTGNGIEVIDVGGASPADAFESRRAVAGAYDYRLYQGGVGADAGNGNWYLRSDISLAAQIYSAYPATLVNFGLASIGTYRQRTGVWSYGPAGATIGDAWIRGAGSWTDASPEGSASYSQGLQFGQAGVEAELPVNLASPGDLALGVMATLGRSSSTVTGSTHGIEGSGSIDTNAYGIGANLTWTGTGKDYGGLYADAVGQLTWYQTGFDASDLGGLASDNGAFGGAISLEVGKWIELSKGWAIVPQGQLAYVSVGGDGFNDRDGTAIGGISGDSLVGRAGVRLEHAAFVGIGIDDAARLNAYLLANLAYSFTGSYGVGVGDLPFSGDDTPLMGELGLGATLQMNASAALYGEASYAAAASGGGDQRWSGNLGFRLDW